MDIFGSCIDQYLIILVLPAIGLSAGPMENTEADVTTSFFPFFLCSFPLPRSFLSWDDLLLPLGDSLPCLGLLSLSSPGSFLIRLEDGMVGANVFWSGHLKTHTIMIVQIHNAHAPLTFGTPPKVRSLFGRREGSLSKL